MQINFDTLIHTHQNQTKLSIHAGIILQTIKSTMVHWSMKNAFLDNIMEGQN
jgi:hypothetical protein